MVFIKTDNYCNLLDEAFVMLHELPDVERYKELPDVKVIQGMNNELLYLSSLDVKKEILSNENFGKYIDTYKEICKYALALTSIQTWTFEEALKVRKSVMDCEELKKCLTTALFDIDSIVKRLRQENGFEDVCIAFYLTQCYELQLTVQDKALQLQEVFDSIDTLIETEHFYSQKKKTFAPIPDKMKRGLDIAVQKGWIEEKNGKYKCIDKKVKIAYFIGQLYECMEIEEIKGKVKPKNAFPKTAINNLFCNERIDSSFYSFWNTYSNSQKERSWKKEVDDVLRQMKL